MGISFLYVSHKTKATAAAGISILDNHLDKFIRKTVPRVSCHNRGFALMEMLNPIL